MTNETIEAELKHARVALEAGNAGKARVCARRAAGWSLRAISGITGDAIKQLKWLRDNPSAPEAVRQAATRLTTKVGHDHALPFPDDPIEDARAIITFVSS